MKKIKLSLVVFLLVAMVVGVIPGYQVEAATVKLNKSSLNMKVGSTYKLKLKNNKKKVMWSSSKKKVASVSATGKVKAKKTGKATIIAKVGNKQYKCKVTVKKSNSASSNTNSNQNSSSTDKNNNSVSIVLNPTSAVVNMGETKALSVTVTPASEQNSVKWSSLDTRIATVSGGLVTGVSAGTTTIVAEVGSVKATCMVQVNQTYGSVTGNVTYYYNKYQGNKPDTGTRVFLISKTGSAKNMPVMNSDVVLDMESSAKKYESYGIYTTKVDGSGNYTFNNIPTGDYLIFMYSSNTTSGTAFNNKEAYVSQIASSVSAYVNETNAQFLGRIVGYHKYYTGNVTVLNNQTTTESYDFGISYN